MQLVTQLNFEKPEGNVPDLNCHWCSAKQSTEGWQIADLKPFENELSTVMVAVCSDACKTNLLRHPRIEIALAGMILNVYSSAGQHEELKEEYKKFFAKLQR